MTHMERERGRLILIPMKTKWYIFPSAGQAWDVHHRVYQDYRNLTHDVGPDILLTKHTAPDERMRWTLRANTQEDKPAGKKLADLTPSDHSHNWAADHCDPWPRVTDPSVGGPRTDPPAPWINTKWLFRDQLCVILFVSWPFGWRFPGWFLFFPLHPTLFCMIMTMMTMRTKETVFYYLGMFDQFGSVLPNEFKFFWLKMANISKCQVSALWVGENVWMP